MYTYTYACTRTCRTFWPLQASANTSIFQTTSLLSTGLTLDCYSLRASRHCARGKHWNVGRYLYLSVIGCGLDAAPGAPGMKHQLLSIAKRVGLFGRFRWTSLDGHAHTHRSDQTRHCKIRISLTKFPTSSLRKPKQSKTKGQGEEFAALGTLWCSVNYALQHNCRLYTTGTAQLLRVRYVVV